MTIVNGVGVSDEIQTEREPTKPTFYFRWKGIFDRTFAALLLIPGLPLIAVLVVLVRLTSRGPGIFRQERVGKGGEVFTMFKLRSMWVDAEHCSGAIWAKDDDPRTTPIGNYLRKFHLDELPQLFNVLKGEMSLIGPRPVPIYEVEEYLDWHRERLAALPGVSGLWQVKGRSMVTFEEMIEMDIEYIHNQSLLLDLKIILLTIPAIVIGSGAE